MVLGNHNLIDSVETNTTGVRKKWHSYFKFELELARLTTSPPDKKTSLSALYHFDLEKKSSPRILTLNKLFNKARFFHVVLTTSPPDAKS